MLSHSTLGPQGRGKFWNWKLTDWCRQIFFMGLQKTIFVGEGKYFFSHQHFFEMMVGLGKGSNNLAELLRLKIILIFAVQKGCRSLNICGDLMNVINWIEGIQIFQNIRLDNIISSMRAVLDTYVSFSCQHVYMENNRQVHKASKEGLQLDLGQWKIKEFIDDSIHEYYHRPFIEGTSPL